MPGVEEQLRAIRSIAVALLVAGGGAVGCTGIYPEQSGTPESGAPAASAAPGTLCHLGRLGRARRQDHSVYLRMVDPDRRMITFDLISLLGEDAAREAAKDHKEFLNDHYIRNVNPRLRMLPVRANATVIVNALAADLTGSAIKNVPVTLAKFATWFPRTGGPPFWLTVEHGQVVRIAEQFLP